MKQFALVLAINLLLLLAIEGVFRLLLAANPQTYFIAGAQKGEVISNLKAFNPLNNYASNPFSFQRQKAPDTKRVFMLGESTMAGLHYNPYASIAKFMDLQLAKALPQQKVEIINAGTGGKSSPDVVKIFKESLAFQPDLAVVYLGQNDFLEPNVFRYRAQRLQPGMTKVRALLRRSAIFAWIETKNIERLSKKPRQAIYEPKMVHESFPGLDRQAVINGYQENLREIARIAKKNNIPVIFITPVSNIRDWEPNVSYFSKAVSADDKRAFETAVLAARKAVQAHDMKTAQAEFAKAEAIDKQVAELQWWKAKAFEQMNQWENAQKAYEIAEDLDGRPFRNLPQFIDDVKRIAAEEGAILVDAQSLFRNVSPNGLIGFNIMIDNCHPDLEGQYIIAGNIIETLAAQNIFAPQAQWQLKSRENMDTDMKALKLTPEQFADIHRRTGNYVLSWTVLRYDPTARLLRALFEFEQAIIYKPDDAEVLFTKALTLQALNRPEQAKIYFEKARAIDAGIDGKTKLQAELLKPLSKTPG